MALGERSCNYTYACCHLLTGVSSLPTSFCPLVQFQSDVAVKLFWERPSPPPPLSDMSVFQNKPSMTAVYLSDMPALITNGKVLWKISNLSTLISPRFDLLCLREHFDVWNPDNSSMRDDRTPCWASKVLATWTELYNLKKKNAPALK